MKCKMKRKISPCLGVYPVVIGLDDQTESLLVSPDQGSERGNHVDRLVLVEVRQL